VLRLGSFGGLSQPTYYSGAPSRAVVFPRIPNVGVTGPAENLGGDAVLEKMGFGGQAFFDAKRLTGHG